MLNQLFRLQVSKATQYKPMMNTPLDNEEQQAAAMAPSAPVMPDNTPLLTEGGDFAPNWYERFDELGESATTLSKFRRPEALAKSYAALERMKGYPGVDDAKRMQAFRLSVGLPEKAEDYAFTRPEGMPDEVWDEALSTKMASVAYEYGVPATAMNAILEHYSSESRAMLEAYAAEQQRQEQAADAELQQDWGLAYESNMQAVGAFIQHMGERAGVDMVALAEEPSLRNNPAFIKLMFEAARTTQEAPMLRGGAGEGAGAAEARRIAHDPNHPLHEAYMRTSHPQHKYANEEYDRLAFRR